MMLVVEHAVWETKHKHQEAALITFSEQGISLDRLQSLESGKAALVAQDFITTIVSTLGRLVGKQLAQQMVHPFHNKAAGED